MPVAYEVPRIQVLATPISRATADLIVVPVAEDHVAAAIDRFDQAVGGALAAALDRGELKPRSCETFQASIVADGWTASRMLFVGGGPVMSSCATQNPSLTYMALTARTADHAVQRMKQGEFA